MWRTKHGDRLNLTRRTLEFRKPKSRDKFEALGGMAAYQEMKDPCLIQGRYLKTYLIE